MDIFGIGPTEVVFILIIALILLGPKEMEKTGRTIGRFLRNLTRSESWHAFRDTSRELRSLPNRLMREANIEDLEKEIGDIGGEIKEATQVEGFGTWSNPAAAKKAPPRTKDKPAEAPASQNIEPKPDSETSEDTEHNA